MELPKNVVQIGKPDRVHKIYIEDYVVSYIKQLNRACDGRAIGLALYGKLCEEEECRYYFLYGAARIEGLEHRGPYLSQSEKEEITERGRQYFEDYEFLAWCTIKGEPLESLFVKVQGKGVEVEGYACFYEKNESMLNYMLLSGQKPTETLGSIPQARETVGEQESIPRVSKAERAAHEIMENGTSRSSKGSNSGMRPARGEWRAADFMHPSVRNTSKAADSVKESEKITNINARKEKTKNLSAKRTEYMKMAAVAAFLVLCVIGITTLNEHGKLEDLQVAASHVIASMTEQKLPDAGEDNTISGGSALPTEETGIQPETTEGAVQTDGAGQTEAEQIPTVSGQENNLDTQADGVGEQESDTGTDGVVQENASQEEYQAASSQSVVVQPPEEQAEPEELPVSYTIVRGDTLISICMSRYGSLDKLKEICEMNHISNADNIQVGQTILLP